MKYIIFSFEIGDFLTNSQGKILVFESQGLAFQYLQKHYHQEERVPVTKKFTEYDEDYPYFQAPFRFHKAG
jgi:hypothetical protein